MVHNQHTIDHQNRQKIVADACCLDFQRHHLRHMLVTGRNMQIEGNVDRVFEAESVVGSEEEDLLECSRAFERTQTESHAYWKGC